MRVTLRDYSFLVNKWPPFLFLQLGTQQHCGILLYSYATEPNHMASLQFVYVVYAHFLSCASTVPFGFDSGRCPIVMHLRSYSSGGTTIIFNSNLNLNLTLRLVLETGHLLSIRCCM